MVHAYKRTNILNSFETKWIWYQRFSSRFRLCASNSVHRKHETEILSDRYNLIWFHRSVFYPFLCWTLMFCLLKLSRKQIQCNYLHPFTVKRKRKLYHPCFIHSKPFENEWKSSPTIIHTNSMSPNIYIWTLNMATRIKMGEIVSHQCLVCSNQIGKKVNIWYIFGRKWVTYQWVVTFIVAGSARPDE